MFYYTFKFFKKFPNLQRDIQHSVLSNRNTSNTGSQIFRELCLSRKSNYVNKARTSLRLEVRNKIGPKSLPSFFLRLAFFTSLTLALIYKTISRVEPIGLGRLGQEHDCVIELA